MKPETPESQHATDLTSHHAASSSQSDILTPAWVKAELVANGGYLKQKTCADLVRQLRSAMTAQQAGTDVQLMRIISMEGWNNEHLCTLLLDCDITDSITEPHVSL